MTALLLAVAALVLLAAGAVIYWAPAIVAWHRRWRDRRALRGYWSQTDQTAFLQDLGRRRRGL